jgi:hypothetical protein
LLYLRLRWLLSAMTMAFLCITYDANTTNGATIDTTNGIGTINGTTIATPPPPRWCVVPPRTTDFLLFTGLRAPGYWLSRIRD